MFISNKINTCELQFVFMCALIGSDPDHLFGYRDTVFIYIGS